MSNVDFKVTLLDSWSANYSQPVADRFLNGTQDVQVIAAMQANGTTTIMFSRPLITNDVAGLDYNITTKPFYLLFGYAAADGFASSFGKHVEASTVRVDFFQTNGSAVYVPVPTMPSPGSAATSLNNLSRLVANASAPMFTSPDGVMRVWWSVDSRGADSNITFTIAASSLGWLSLGINTRPLMTNSDDYVVRDMFKNEKMFW